MTLLDTYQQIWMSGEAADAAARLTGLRKNRVDRFPVATAIRRRATLPTADRALLEWSGSLQTADVRL